MRQAALALGTATKQGGLLEGQLVEDTLAFRLRYDVLLAETASEDASSARRGSLAGCLSTALYSYNPLSEAQRAADNCGVPARCDRLSLRTATQRCAVALKELLQPSNPLILLMSLLTSAVYVACEVRKALCSIRI